MKFDKLTFCLPSWAIPYLVNNDMDNLTDEEIRGINLFLSENELKGCLMSVGEEQGFRHINDLDNFGSDCYDVTFLRPAKDTKRKTVDTYEIWANYGQGPESVTGAENRQDAKRLLKEYRENEPGTHHWIKKVRVPNPHYIPTPFEQIICPVNSKFGAPMGRQSVLLPGDGKTFAAIFDRRVPLNSGGYDKGGAYWGLPDNLRVRYTKNLSLVHFYRGDSPRQCARSIGGLKELVKY